MAAKVKLIFDVEFDERVAYEAEARGWFSGAHVELDDGRIHPVEFYSPIRLGQDLDVEAENGRPFIAEKGLIVLKGVTRENMEAAVEYLASVGFFD